MSNPTITRKEEYEALAQAFAPYFLQYLRKSATAVDDIETFDPGDGELPPYVKSLPARYDYGGVRKTVLVPVEVLGRDARKAAEEARQSATNADRSAAEADLAASRANTAADRVDDAVLDLTREKGAVLDACKKAEEAANNANGVADELRKTNDEIRGQEEQRISAEEERSARFVLEFQAFIADALKELEGFDSSAREALAKFSEDTERLIDQWNEFVVDFKYRYLEIEAQETQRQEAEVARQQATANAISFMNTSLMEFREELDGAVKHSEITLLQPDDIREMWKSICAEDEDPENNEIQSET